MNFVFNAGSWQKEMINEKEIRKLYFSPQKKKKNNKKKKHQQKKQDIFFRMEHRLLVAKEPYFEFFGGGKCGLF